MAFSWKELGTDEYLRLKNKGELTVSEQNWVREVERRMKEDLEGSG